MTGRELDETRISGRLPHLDIEITHRRLPGEEAEQLLIAMRATPSFAAFGQVLEAGRPMLATMLAANPFFAAWMRMAQAVWGPFLPSGILPEEPDRLPDGDKPS
jgi:hypothetical protein